MKKYLIEDAWCIIEDGFHPEFQEVSESIFSLGNGRFGGRGNFEEGYSGKTLPGAYFAGVYYPDVTRVGWWKNGYPEYFAKVLNGVHWIGLEIKIDGEKLDLATTPCTHFRRTLDMQQGLLQRSFEISPASGGTLSFAFERFCSMADPDVACIELRINSTGFTGRLEVTPFLDFDVHNRDANYGDQFWIDAKTSQDETHAMVSSKTKKTNFTVSSFMHTATTLNDHISIPSTGKRESKKVSNHFEAEIQDGSSLRCRKLVVNLNSLYVADADQPSEGKRKLSEVVQKGYDEIKREHIEAWKDIWDTADIQITGDLPAQQGIRFNIFQLWQTYTGKDARLNIGPKGFTGEKYGGSTYWDTEAYCIPFYLSTGDAGVARNLLVYRYLHLPKAIENASKLGFSDGAALYPMVTMNGEECHNEWEITFEEIHRNGAMVYAIYDYIRYTGDTSYLLEGGLEVMISICRFWKQRVNYSRDKNAWVMLGVTGPNEYENNVNNNWYTNYIARWCWQYTIEQIKWAAENHPVEWETIQEKLNYQDGESDDWRERIKGIYLPFDETRSVYLQQDGFLDKELQPVKALPSSDLPLNQKWSWDRILRSCYIKQADVLQGMYFFEDHFEADTVRRHFEFYEPMTVHESSLSPCVHAILASRLGMKDKATEMYHRTARLDLDDYNNDTEDGLHITSMAGTWMSVVRGFAGLRVIRDELHFEPSIPDEWDGLAFTVHFRGRIMKIAITKDECEVVLRSGSAIPVFVRGERRELNIE